MGAGSGGLGHGEHCCTLALDGSQNPHGFQGCPRLWVFSQPSRKMSSGLYWFSLEPLRFAPLAGGFCCSQSGTRTPDGCSAPCWRSRMLLLSWEWEGMVSVLQLGESCEDSVHIQGAVRSWPSPPLSPINQAPYPCPYTLYTLSCPICCNLTWHTACCTPSPLHSHSYTHLSPPCTSRAPRAAPSPTGCMAPLPIAEETHQLL